MSTVYKKPYFLKTGIFKGRSLEEMMFTLDGYNHLQRIKRKLIAEGGNIGFLKRLDEVLIRGRNLRIKKKCLCEKAKASLLACKRGIDGTVFVGLYCETCKDEAPIGYSLIPLSFASLSRFGSNVDKNCFLRELRHVCDLELEGRVDDHKAFVAFFPGNPRLL